jgi:hypothetical protein
MTPEVNLLYSLFANHPADGRELAHIGGRGVHATDVSTGRGRWLGRIARRPRVAGAAARA